MQEQLEKYLLSAQGKEQGQLPADNPYRQIAFDAGQKRLGWMRVVPFGKLEGFFKKVAPLIQDKKSFIFVGIGGSGNGIKSLLSLFSKHSLYTLDSLDPAALKEISIKIEDVNKTLVVAVSKSGTTKETQLLAAALKEGFGRTADWRRHFLWLADPAAHPKLDAAGWSGVDKVPIQFDGESDIGGRFSCPHTAIFYLPLFLLLDRDLAKVEDIYMAYNSLQGKVRQQAYALYHKYKDVAHAFFTPVLRCGGDAFFPWIVQLFQESLGSKAAGLTVKTVRAGGGEDFLPLKLELETQSPVVYLMAQMYFFQVFTAFYAAHKSINFVNQDFVEKYKEQLRQLKDSEAEDFTVLDLEQLTRQVAKQAGSRQFIEIVLYFHAPAQLVDLIRDRFRRAYPGRVISVFIGSDWNHHSYQAAFSDKDTFYVLLLAPAYADDVASVAKETLRKNVRTLKLIGKATYLTLKDKSLLASLSI